MKLCKHLVGGELGLSRLLLSFSTDMDSWNQLWYPIGTKRFLNYDKSADRLLKYMCYILVDFNSKIISCDPKISVIRFFYCRMFWFILQTSEFFLECR